MARHRVGDSYLSDSELRIYKERRVGCWTGVLTAAVVAKVAHDVLALTHWPAPLRHGITIALCFAVYALAMRLRRQLHGILSTLVGFALLAFVVRGMYHCLVAIDTPDPSPEVSAPKSTKAPVGGRREAKSSTGPVNTTHKKRQQGARRETEREEAERATVAPPKTRTALAGEGGGFQGRSIRTEHESMSDRLSTGNGTISKDPAPGSISAPNPAGTPSVLPGAPNSPPNLLPPPPPGAR